MSSVIQNLLNETLGDGARSTKFECMINFKNTSLFPNSSDTLHLVKTSQFPGKSHDVIDLKFKGRTIPIKGQVKYDNTWSCTFYLTQDHKLKKAFEDWIESLDQNHNMGNTSNAVKASQMENMNSGYITNMQIMQMDFHGSQQTAVYELFNVFPKSISGVDVDYSAVGSILEFTVEFSYSHYNLITEDVSIAQSADDIKSKQETESTTNQTQRAIPVDLPPILSELKKSTPNSLRAIGYSTTTYKFRPQLDEDY